MNDNDELNDSAVLSAVRDSISGLPMPTAPRLQAITARGRARRRCRLAGVYRLPGQAAAGPDPAGVRCVAALTIRCFIARLACALMHPAGSAPG